MITKSASQVKAFGKTIKGLRVKEWEEDSSLIMKDLLKESFEQNPDALTKLLATGNATLTHTQDKTKWGIEFPKLLMEVRNELRTTQPVKPPVLGDRPVFDSLPSKSTTPTMTYAGIGSRETPQEVLDVMPEVAKYLESLGYTLRSGRAPGADAAFEKGVTSKKEIFPGNVKTGERELKIAEEIHPAWNVMLDSIRKKAIAKGNNPERSAAFVANLMARNTNQIFGANLDTPVDFVIFYAKETTNPLRPAGGTGQAVEMARRKGIPTINMADTNWRDQLKTALANKPTQPSTSAPIREELEELTEAREAYKSLFIANKKPPITFTVGVSTWKLNKNFNYDLIDQDTGEVQLKNVNMVTGMIEEDAVEYTILTRKQLNDYIKDFEQKVITFNLEDLLAIYGIDIQDVYKRLNSATTTEDLIEIETEINRKLCQ